MNKRLKLIFIFLTQFSLELFCSSKVMAGKSLNPIEEIANRLTGVMVTTITHPEGDQITVQMTTCSVQVENYNNDPSSGIYLYQEQAINSTLQNPYRQRFLWIHQNTEGNLESLSFRPQNSKNWINFCNKLETERVITRDELGNTVCTVILRKIINDYIGETPPEGCPANIRGATRITNTIILRSNSMDTWDRGFDAQGHQVWGAESQAYEYIKQ